MDKKGAITVVLTDTARRRDRAGAGASVGTTSSLVIGNGCCDSTAPFLFAHYYAGPE